MISILQKPLSLTPTNVEHIYSVSSPNSGNTDYRYVFDVYVDTLTNNPTRVARKLVSPNSYGKGIINVERIVENYTEGNARADEPQYTSESTTATTAYGIITNVKGIANSNAFNTNNNYNIQTHIRDYRVMVGEQWTDASGNTLTYISTASTTPGSTFTAAVVSGRPSWYGAGAGIPEGSSLEKGVDWYYQGTSGTSSNIDGNILPLSPTPIAGYTVEIIEKYTGIQADFEYTGFEWVLLGYTYPAGGNYQGFYSPPAIIIWPGTSLKQGSYSPYVNGNEYWTTSIPDEQQNFWEVKKYRMSGTTVSEIEPSRFLTTAGEELFSVDYTNAGITTDRSRRRKHHPSCPILVSWFNGILSQNTDFLFENPVGCFTSVEAETQSEDYPYSGLTEYAINGNTFTGITSADDRILYFNTIRPDLAGGKMGFWTAGDVGDYQYDGYAFSEFLEYYIQDDDCLSDPVHFLFLNRQGVWDTYTFDRKALRKSEITRKTYGQGGIRDLNSYSLLSTNRRKTIYDQDITQVMSVSSWFLTDNDKQIVEDLFMSPEIYIIKEHDWTGKAEKTYNPYLLPVVLNTGSITEFKNRYNKMVQYTFDLEYTPINEYRTQG